MSTVVSRGRMRDRLVHLPSVLAATGGVFAVAVVVAYFVSGLTAALGVAAGVGMVAASYLVSTLAIAWADTVHIRLVLPVGLVAYTLKFTLIGVAMAGLAHAGWPGLTGMGAGIIVGLLVWTIAQAVWVWRTDAARNPAAHSTPEGQRS
jgi:hypothetical protein